MVFAIFTLISALSISCVAAYFSIIGLATIFPGSVAAVITMGVVLELGKIIAAIWLHRNWKVANFLIKSYLSFAVFVLMGITSMGIFGFLSKSHIEHQSQASQEQTLIADIDTKINKEKGLLKQHEDYISLSQNRLSSSDSQSNIEIEREEKRIVQILNSLKDNINIEQSRIDNLTERRKQLDDTFELLESQSGGLFSNKKKKIEELKDSQAEERKQIFSLISQYNSNIEVFREESNTEISLIRKNIEKFRSQSGGNLKEGRKEIEQANSSIRISMDRISELEREKLKYGEKIRSLEAEIGPLRYVAEAIQDFGGTKLASDQAVRIIIIILMLVFDPLAILLVIAAHTSLEKVLKNSYPKLSERINKKKDPSITRPPDLPKLSQTRNDSPPKNENHSRGRNFHINTLPNEISRNEWSSLSHREKYLYAIKWNWKAKNFTFLKDHQPIYNPDKQSFLPD
jgi:DNA repair exonuclease SbcCD ATPase subunit